jgi:hypothetical protein
MFCCADEKNPGPSTGFYSEYSRNSRTLVTVLSRQEIFSLYVLYVYMRQEKACPAKGSAILR